MIQKISGKNRCPDCLKIYEEEKAKGKKLKCKECGKSDLHKSEMIEKTGRYYCPECMIIHDERVKKNTDGFDDLFQYICKTYKIKTPTDLMFKQISDFRENYKYTNFGVYLTLKYYYEILESEVKDDSGIGIVPYYYDKAKKHYNRVYDLQDMVDNYNFEDNTIIIKSKLRDFKAINKEPLQIPSFEELEENDEGN